MRMRGAGSTSYLMTEHFCFRATLSSVCCACCPDAVMGDYALTVQNGWMVYDRWLDDPRVQFHPEPRHLDGAFRQATQAFATERASKWIGDGYLLAFAREAGATLVTFDKALLGLARKENCSAIIPGRI